VRTIGYSSSNNWTIGASSPNIRVQGYPRTWNGVIVVNGSGAPPPLPPATSISVASDKPVYHRGEPVQISGTLLASGNGIPNIPVTLEVSANGTNRNLTAYTDAQGIYRGVFQPASNDGGAFTVTATGTSGGASQTATASFRILGLLVTPTSVNQDLLMGSTVTVPFDVKNLGDSTLGGMTYSLTVLPSGSVAAAVGQNQTSLASRDTLNIPVTVTAPPALRRRCQ
jgi:hypothetical protein